MKAEKENKTKQQQTSNKIILRLTSRDAAPESHQVRPEHDAIRNGFPCSDFDKRRISQPKTK